jgi:hypothetical protein
VAVFRERYVRETMRFSPKLATDTSVGFNVNSPVAKFRLPGPTPELAE